MYLGKGGRRAQVETVENEAPPNAGGRASVASASPLLHVEAVGLDSCSRLINTCGAMARNRAAAESTEIKGNGSQPPRARHLEGGGYLSR